MQVKTFKGTSSTAVLASIKADLGPDAVILETRETREDGKKIVIMTAALERAAQPSFSASGQADSAHDASSGGSPFGGGMPAGWKMWHDEWSSIKGHLLALMKPELKFDQLTPRQRVAIEYLQRQRVDDTVILELYKRLLPHPGVSVLDPLNEMVPIRSWGTQTWPQQIHLLAGPFGVGKTTVAVRLALWLRKNQPGIRICLVNADAERGGGRLMLKNYAELADVEYRETSSSLETIAIVAEARSQGFDKVIVDLPGLSRDKNLNTLLAELNLRDPAYALHLVLSPQFEAPHYRTLLTRYCPGSFQGRDASIIWTKLDEVESFGPLVNISAASTLPIAAFSFGPGLRNTLIPARDAALWRLLFKRELPNAASAA